MHFQDARLSFSLATMDGSACRPSAELAFVGLMAALSSGALRFGGGNGKQKTDRLVTWERDQNAGSASGTRRAMKSPTI